MSIPPSSVSCWLLLFLSWPASHFYSQFSFRHAPVSKGVFFASAAATFACFSSKNAADFVDVRHFVFVIRLLPLTIAKSDKIVFYCPRSGCEACAPVSNFSGRERCAVRPLHAVLVQMLRAHDGAAQVRTTSLPSNKTDSSFYARNILAIPSLSTRSHRRYFSLAATSAVLSASLQAAASTCFDVK